jgi:hypothetical protein
MAKKERVLCSPLELYITDEGTPVSNAIIRREVSWLDDKFQEEVIGEDGFVFLPAIEAPGGAVVWSILALPITITQKIYLVESESRYLILETVKRNFHVNDELAGIPFKLSCEMSEDMQVHKVGPLRRVVRTRCRWDLTK